MAMLHARDVFFTAGILVDGDGHEKSKCFSYISFGSAFKQSQSSGAQCHGDEAVAERYG